MNVDGIQNGVVIDHITEGRGFELYQMLELNKSPLSHSVALLQSVRSRKYGRKDLIKVEGEPLPSRLDILGYLDPQITLIYIRDGKVTAKKSPKLPARLVNVIRCTNPRCITSIEPDCDHIFEMMPSGKYRCVYCNAEFNPAQAED